MNQTYIFENPNCDSCEHWQYDASNSKLYKMNLGRCDHLDNDFCCGGKKEHDAGVIGGGNFLTKGTFWCKYWSHK